jgi:hypothetical protein
MDNVQKLNNLFLIFCFSARIKATKQYHHSVAPSVSIKLQGIIPEDCDLNIHCCENLKSCLGS